MAEAAERLAYLRRDQGRGEEARHLVPYYLEHARHAGGVTYGQKLSAAGAILTRLGDYAAAARLARQALSYLPSTGDRYHISALGNLAHATVGAPTRRRLLAALETVRGAIRHAERNSSPWLRLHWFAGNLLRCPVLGRYTEAAKELEIALGGIEHSNPVDRALLIVDFAELHLDAGEPERARHLAGESFGVLQPLKTIPECYRAMRLFYCAATGETLDHSVLGAVRARLLERG